VSAGLSIWSATLSLTSCDKLSDGLSVVGVASLNGLSPWGQCYGQGDEIGRIFAYWAIVYFDQFFENFKSSPNFWAHVVP
jgi:hypothetical protein